MLNKFIGKFYMIMDVDHLIKIPLRWKRIITEEIDKTNSHNIFLKKIFSKIELNNNDYLRFNMP